MKAQKGHKLKSGNKLFCVWVDEDIYKFIIKYKEKTIKDFAEKAIIEYCLKVEDKRNKATDMIVEKEKL